MDHKVIETRMAQSPSLSPAPVTEDALLADRQKFWAFFTGATTGAVVFIAVLLILMAIFLL
jgi:hypothetical protein